MFSSFTENFYGLCVAREYRLLKPDWPTPSTNVDNWMIGKMENASMCYVHVYDCDRFAPALIKERQASLTRWAEEQFTENHRIFNLFILVTEAMTSVGSEEGDALSELLKMAEDYCGQPIYNVYWRVVLTEGIIDACPGQPDDLFGLRGLMVEALKMSTRDATESLTFEDVAKRVEEASPYKLKRSFALFTWVIMAVNLLVLVLMYLDGYPNDPETALRFGAIRPSRIWENGEYYRLFTSMFVHSGIAHWAFNSVGLYIFGTRIERRFGYTRFLILYGVSGLCGSIASLFLTRGYSAGASGAIYGLIGAVFAYTRVSKRSLESLTNYIMLIYIGVGLATGFASPNIDNFAHIGGLLGGVLIGGIMTEWLKRKKNNGNLYEV